MDIQTKDGILLRNIPEGTPEKVIKDRIATIRNARKTYDPTEGMSGLEKFGAGAVSGLHDLYLGGKQLLGLERQEDIDERKRLMAPLMNTGAGLAGNITGKVAAALPTAAIPGAQTLLGAGLIGGGLSALDPVATGESRARNAIFGTLGGSAGQALGKTIPTIGKALIDPFRKKGQEQIAAKALQEFAGKNADDVMARLAQSTELVPGSVPTAAEVSKSGGIAQLQRGLQSANPLFADDLAARALDQNAARLSALQKISGTADDLSSATSRRSELGGKLYEKALGQKVKVDDELISLITRPSVSKSINKAASIAEEKGKPLANLLDKKGKYVSVEALHNVKMAMDDLIDTAPVSGIGKSELSAIKETRSKLLSWLDNANPAYKSARVRYDKASRPINRMEVGQEILSKSTRSQLPNARGDFTLYPDAFAKAMKSGDQIVKSETGLRKGLLDVMTPEQIGTLNSIRDDLARSVAGQNIGRSVGSNTAQNLASQNILGSISRTLGVPGFVRNSTLGEVVGKMRFLPKFIEQGPQDVLGKALLDPRYAAQIMQRLSPSQRAMLMDEIGTQMAIGGGAASAGLLGQ